MDGPLGLGKRKNDTKIFLALQPLGSHSLGAGAALPKLSGCCGKNLVNQRKGINLLAVLLGFVKAEMAGNKLPEEHWISQWRCPGRRVCFPGCFWHLPKWCGTWNKGTALLFTVLSNNTPCYLQGQVPCRG